MLDYHMKFSEKLKM